MRNCNTSSVESNKLIDATLYREITGTLIYVMTCTRPDLSYTVSKLAQFMANPTHAHLNMAKHVLKYLKGTSDYCLKFSKCNDFKLYGFCDSDWGNSKDRKSWSGYCIQMTQNTSLISWKTKKQHTVALSSCEAEYIALTFAIQESNFLCQLISELTNCVPKCVTIFADNQGAIKLAKNPVFHQRSKHIDIKYHYSRDELTKNKVCLHYIMSDNNKADLFTKAVSKSKLNKFSLCYWLYIAYEIDTLCFWLWYAT